MAFTVLSMNPGERPPSLAVLSHLGASNDTEAQDVSPLFVQEDIPVLLRHREIRDERLSGRHLWHGQRVPGARFWRLKRLVDFNLDVAPTINSATLATGHYLDAGDPVVWIGDFGTTLWVGPGRPLSVAGSDANLGKRVIEHRDR